MGGMRSCHRLLWVLGQRTDRGYGRQRVRVDTGWWSVASSCLYSVGPGKPWKALEQGSGVIRTCFLGNMTGVQ